MHGIFSTNAATLNVPLFARVEPAIQLGNLRRLDLRALHASCRQKISSGSPSQMISPPAITTTRRCARH
jgi:hypothetical protein